MNNKFGYVNLAIVGTKSYNDYDKFLEVIHNILDVYSIVPGCIISGGAKGVDTLAEDYAKEFEIKPKIFPAEWTNASGIYDKGAGMKRNALIIENADFVVAIWDGKSSGTKNSIKRAKNLNKPLVIYNYIEDKIYEFNIKHQDILEL